MNELMSSPVVAVRPAVPVAAARNTMLKKKVGHLAVLEKGSVVGMISMSDIAFHMWREARSRVIRPLDTVPVSSLMSTNVASVSVGTDVSKAARIMVQRGIGSVLVSDGGDIVGIVTGTDMLIGFIRCNGLGKRAVDIMSLDVVTVGRRSSLSHALKRIISAGSRGAVVLDGKKPVGVITGLDIAMAHIDGVNSRKMARFTRKKERAGRPMARHVREVFPAEVNDLMKPDPVTVREEESADAAAGVMVERDIEILPVLSGDELAGIITKSGVLKALAGGAEVT